MTCFPYVFPVLLDGYVSGKRFTTFLLPVSSFNLSKWRQLIHSLGMTLSNCIKKRGRRFSTCDPHSHYNPFFYICPQNIRISPFLRWYTLMFYSSVLHFHAILIYSSLHRKYKWYINLRMYYFAWYVVSPSKDSIGTICLLPNTSRL